MEKNEQMIANVQEFISGKRIAVVGASSTNDKNKFGNMAAAELKKRGYTISFVHPKAATIDGETTYPNLAAVQGNVDGVLVSIPATKSPAVLREAAAVGLRNVWLQQGGESPELVALGKELNLKLVTGRCILMYAQPVRSYHTIHRFVARVIGQL